LKILVTFAVDAEFAPWRKRHGFESVIVGKLKAFRAVIRGVETNVLITGIGPSNAAASTMVYFIMQSAENEEMDACISAGLVGVLRPGHSIGKPLAARSVGMSLEDNKGSQPDLLSNDLLLRLAAEHGVVPVEKFLTVDHIIQTAKEKLKLSQISEAVEMESYEVFKSAAAWGVPVVAIRSVSDLEGEDLPIDLSDAVDTQGQVSSLKVLLLVAKHPLAIPRFARFARNSRKAAFFLANFLDRYVSALDAHRNYFAKVENSVSVT
jgi:nucleoside phosphorylase